MLEEADRFLMTIWRGLADAALPPIPPPLLLLLMPLAALITKLEGWFMEDALEEEEECRRWRDLELGEAKSLEGIAFDVERESDELSVGC